MKNKTTLLVLLLIVVVNCFAKKANYFHYHNLINRAESNFFLHENIDSAVYLYKKAFKDFDFVFAKDCIMAAQIAVYAKRNNEAVDFIEKGFENGITIKLLQNIKILNNFLSNANLLKQIIDEYPKHRQIYLKRINTTVLRKINYAFYVDELNKNRPKNLYPDSTRNELNIKTIKLIDSITKKVGFPGEKLIGIEQPNLLTELGFPMDECNNRFKTLTEKEKKDLVKGDQHEIQRLKLIEDLLNEDNSSYIAASKLYVLLIHYPCAFSKLSTLWLKSIKKGEIHPRDIASLYDWQHGLFNRDRILNKQFDCPIIQETYNDYFYNCFFAKYYEMQNSKTIGYGNPNVFIPLTDTKETNKMRRAMYMVDYEVDLAKNKYQKEYGFKIRFGEFGQL